MGFLNSVSRFLGGGSKSSSGGVSQSGFGLLPGGIKDSFTNYANQFNTLLNDGGLDAFTPLPQTEFETSALNTVSQGLTPTQESLRADIAMQMNPFDEFVINDINRAADSDYSILKRAMSDAGQLGSNRQLLGANDIEQTRLNTIGNLRQSQYNNALDNSLNEILGARQADVTDQFGAGQFLRDLDAQTRQADITGLQTFGNLLGALPQTGGSTSTNTSSSSTQNGMGDIISGIGSVFRAFRPTL